MPAETVAKVLSVLAAQYPADLVAGQTSDIPRIAFHIETVLSAARPKRPRELAICDFGGGIGLFSLGCAAIGVRRVVLVDDFRDSINDRVGERVLELHRSYGVEVMARDIVEEGMEGLDEPFDAITCFDSVEHWHHSPRKLFRDAATRLAAGGTFILSAPNCVNLRKRLSVMVGRGQWSSMDDWYEQERFRGHVREPDVSDLRYIARDMGLTSIRIFGRNWMGYGSSSKPIRHLTKIVDVPLRLRPGLCSNIYVCGTKL